MAELEAELAAEMEKSKMLDGAIAAQQGGQPFDMDAIAAMMGGAEPVEGEAPAPAEAPMQMEPEQPQAPPPTLTDDQVLEAADPKIVERATGRMVEAGLIERATGTITPEVEAILVATVDANYPGMLDLRQPADLNELLNGVSNGIVDPVAPAGKLG